MKRTLQTRRDVGLLDGRSVGHETGAAASGKTPSRACSITPLLAALVLLTAIHAQRSALAQGSLTPPGAPAATMKTLQQVEPRIPISSLPFAISNAGSYYLTTNLTGSAGANGITITANDVTLDLGGFVLAGGGNSNGVRVVGSRTNLAVQNGTIRNWHMGIEADASFNCRFERVLVSKNASVGIFAGSGSLVASCQANENFFGFLVGDDCVIKSSIATSNTASGISTGAGCTIVDCTASRNNRGIEAFDGSTVQSCTVRENGANGGINASASTVVNCTVDSNLGDGISIDRGTVRNCTVRNNRNDGIDAFIGCQIAGNLCLDNGLGGDGAGINAAMGGHTIEGNFVSGNDRGIDCNPSTGNLIISNRAKDNTVEYDIVLGNHSGAIVLNPGLGFSNSNPWANFDF